MWRAVFLLFFVTSTDYYRFVHSLNFHTEGGSFSSTNQKNDPRDEYSQYLNTETNDNSYDDLEYLLQLQQQKQKQRNLFSDDDYSGDRLANIVKAVREQQEQHPYEQQLNYDDYKGRESTHTFEELQKFGKKIKELEAINLQNLPNTKPTSEGIDSYEQKNDYVLQPSGKLEKPLSAQKKGQSEYVEFIEPNVGHNNKVLKNIEYLEKRRPAHDFSDADTNALSFISASGNVVFLAFVAMCCVFSIVGIVGGMYYYNHSKITHEDPFDDFTRYSPAGPGRDRLKKDGGNGRGIFGGNVTNISPLGSGNEKGDDTLAYKAQLHHYQQTKQKIIGSDSNAIGANHSAVDASDKSDDEDDADLEHNFSVYECPGLAPTGDIEVQNPNFVDPAQK